MIIGGSGVEVELTGFTVSGPGPAACGSIAAGIVVRDGANANIHDNTVQDVRDSTFSGCQNGIAILVGRNSWTTTGTATIANNTIVGYQKGGIVVDNTGSSATITNNIVTGAGTTDVTAQNGIQISRGATATLSGNTVTGNSYYKASDTTYSWGAAGLLLYQAGAVSLTGGNTITGNDQNISNDSTALTLGAETLGNSTAPVDFGYDIAHFGAYNLDASSVTFLGSADNFAIEDRIWHVIDEAGDGLVTWDSGNLYVTPLSEEYQNGALQRAIAAASAGNTVNVAAGTYDEDVNLNKSLSLLGAGAASTTLRGVIGGDSATVRVGASNVTVAGFTITRLGNNTTDWNDSGLNSAGIAVIGTSITGMNIHDNILTGNRTGIDINNSSGHTIQNNAITDNRTGLLFRNTTDNMTVTGNEITDNWTVGILFLDASGGTNVPVQSALNSTFSQNNLSGNWYGQVVERQTGGSLPAPGTTNLKNFVQNWWGTASPVVSTADSTEPGYAALIPVEFGGSATAPGGQPDILGPASANIVYDPWYVDEAMTILSSSTPATVYVDDDFSNGSAGGHIFGYDAFATVQAGIDAVAAGGTVEVAAGSYIENVIVSQSVTIAGAGAASTIVMPAVSNANPCTSSSLCGGTASNVFLIQANDVTIHDLTVEGDNPALTSGIVRGGADLDARNGIIKNTDANYNNLEVYNVTVQNIYLRGVYSTGGSFNFHNNTVTNVQGDGSSIAMFAWGGPGTMQSNTVSYANDAISANHSSGIQFLGNTVTNSLSGIHTDNSGDGGGVSDLIQGNQIDCTGTTGAYGIWTFVPYLAPTVNNNTVVNCDVGLSAWGQGAAVTHTFTNNTVTGNLAADGVGAYITTDLISWGYSDISVLFTGNTISGYETGIYLAGEAQSWNPVAWSDHTINATFHLNQIYDNTTPAAKGATGTYAADLESNWWGSPAGPSGINGLDYIPWCTDAGCTQLSGIPVSQWASGATASSEYTYTSWGAVQATGAPNTNSCGDRSTAWSPKTSGSGCGMVENDL